MSAATVTKREPPYEIKLTKKDARFVFDYDEAHRVYRVSWYQRRRKPCSACDGRGFRQNIPGLCKECHGHRFVWPIVRSIGKSAELVDAIAVARGEYEKVGNEIQAWPTLDTVFLARYVFSTDWGADLPHGKDELAAEGLLDSEENTRRFLQAKFDSMPRDD